jgi:hypothetical protein
MTPMSEPQTQPTAAPAKPAPPQRVLPSQEEIAAWIGGDEGATVGALFETLDVKRFDVLVLQVRKEELVPQHWQAISRRQAPDDAEFDRLPEAGRLRLLYKDGELARRRLGALKVAWRELRGRRPALWTVPDLFAAIRRIIEHQREVDFNDLLSASRDVWRTIELPSGREQLDILWNCLALIRTNTKK